jgi:hypothetical protein
MAKFGRLKEWERKAVRKGNSMLPEDETREAEGKGKQLADIGARLKAASAQAASKWPLLPPSFPPCLAAVNGGCAAKFIF